MQKSKAEIEKFKETDEEDDSESTFSAELYTYFASDKIPLIFQSLSQSAKFQTVLEKSLVHAISVINSCVTLVFETRDHAKMTTSFFIKN